jgi:glutaredoxin 3
MRTQTKTVRIFTTAICPWCDSAKRYCAENDIAYTEVDIEADRHGLRDMLVMTGQHAVPVIQVGDKAMVGWDPDEFHRLMGWEERAGPQVLGRPAQPEAATDAIG